MSENRDQPLFSNITYLTLANNPLNWWDAISELSKLENLESLIVSNEVVEGRGNCFMEHTIGRLLELKTLNRTTVTRVEKRDFQTFYLQAFGSDYYQNGGSDNPGLASLSAEFVKKHPTYLKVAQIRGAPVDERLLHSHTYTTLGNLKLQLTLVNTKVEPHCEIVKTLLPTMTVSRLKLMVLKSFKLDIKIGRSCL